MIRSFLRRLNSCCINTSPPTKKMTNFKNGKAKPSPFFFFFSSILYIQSAQLQLYGFFQRDAEHWVEQPNSQLEKTQVTCRLCIHSAKRGHVKSNFHRSIRDSLKLWLCTLRIVYVLPWSENKGNAAKVCWTVRLYQHVFFDFDFLDMKTIVYIIFGSHSYTEFAIIHQCAFKLHWPTCSSLCLSCITIIFES